MNIVFSANAPVLRATNESEDFSYSVSPAVPTQPIYGVAGATEELADCFAVPVSKTLSHNVCQVSVVDSLTAPGHRLVSRDSSMATISGDTITGVGTTLGLVPVDVVTPAGTRSYSFNNGSEIDPAHQFVTQYKDGSLAKHIVDGVMANIAGKTPSDTTQKAFTTNNYNSATPNAVRNPNIFSGAISLSGFGIMNDRQDGVVGALGGDCHWMHPPVLISSRHILSASHWHPHTKVVFLDKLGNYHTRTIVANTSSAPNLDPILDGVSGIDLYVGYLNAVVPDCDIVKVMPSNWSTYLPTSGPGIVRGVLPAYVKMCFKNVGSLPETISDQLGVCWTEQYETPLGTVRYKNEVSILALPPFEHGTLARWGYLADSPGSSASPVFFRINNDNVLITFRSPAYNISVSTTLINAAMNNLAVAQGEVNPTYALLHPDLSRFTSYA